MKIIINRVILAISLIIVFNANLFARPDGWPLEGYLDRATTIALVKVKEGRQASNENSACAFVYIIDLKNPIRGKRPTKVLSQKKLTVGGEYLLVAAEKTPWEDRRLGIDIPSAVNLPGDECKGKEEQDTVLASYAELFLVYRNLIPKNTPLVNAWVAVPPHWLSAPKGTTQLIGMDRIEVKNYKIDEPPTEIMDYFKLEEVINIAINDKQGLK